VVAETELGLKAKDLMSKGLLVPDEIVIGMIDSKIKNNPTCGGFVFDGFPRTVEQAKSLDGLLEKNQLPPVKIIALIVDEEELTTRILERGKIEKRIDDQNETLIKQRFKEYHTKTSLVADYYKQKKRLSSINGMGNEAEIFENICKIIDKN